MRYRPPTISSGITRGGRLVCTTVKTTRCYGTRSTSNVGIIARAFFSECDFIHLQRRQADFCSDAQGTTGRRDDVTAGRKPPGGIEQIGLDLV